MVENLDPNTIEDEGLRQVVITLMNLVETLSAKVQVQAEEIQRLRDENKRLKGEQGQLKIKANTLARALSSEKERHKPKAHRKAKKQALVKIDRVEVLKVDQERLPHDAQGKRLRERHCAGYRVSHREHDVPQREILLPQPKTDLFG